MKDELNKYGIFITDKFILNYYNILIIFEVCKTQTDSVTIYELQTEHTEINGKNAVILNKKLLPAKDPYIVPKGQNSQSKSHYNIVPSTLFDDIRLPIAVPFNSKLYNKAKANGTKYPTFGIVYAERLKEYLGVYWAFEDESERTNFDA